MQNMLKIWSSILGLKKVRVVLFSEIGRVKFFYHLPVCICRMCMRIYIFCFKKNTHKQKNLYQQIYSYEFTFFSVQTIKDRALCFSTKKVLLEQYFESKLCSKNSMKLVKRFFCGHPDEDFFCHTHFLKQEYYFFWS